MTGAGKGGIGTKIAEILAGTGVKVYLNGRNAAQTEKTSSELSQKFGFVAPAVADITDASQVAATVEKIISAEGRLDILVNNAAPNQKQYRVDKLPSEIWDIEVNTILKGSYYCCREAVPYMIERLCGRIIFISSSAAFRGTKGRSVSYAAAKAGLHGMTVQLALELAPYQITVNAIAPSQIDTPRIRQNGRRTDESLAKYARDVVPLGRVGTPNEVASLAVYLASDSASYITGQIISVDGGTFLSKGTETTNKSDDNTKIA